MSASKSLFYFRYYTIYTFTINIKLEVTRIKINKKVYRVHSCIRLTTVWFIYNIYIRSNWNHKLELYVTSCSMEGKVPPSLRRPHPVTVAFSPISRSSEAGRQIGEICGANSSGLSSWTRARSYSYVKKLYLGWTILRATPRSTYGISSWTLEKSYSPTRILIWEVNKLEQEINFMSKKSKNNSYHYYYQYLFAFKIYKNFNCQFIKNFI